MSPRAPARRSPTLASRLAANVPFALLLAAAILWQFGVVRTLRVSSTNMAPTLSLDERVLVRSWGGAPVPGDVIAYRSPFDPSRLHVGRVVAAAGARVELSESGLRLDGHVVSAPLKDCPAVACAVGAARPAGTRNAACEGEASCDAACRAEDCLLGTESLGGRSYYTRRVYDLASLYLPATVVPEDHVFVLSDNRADDRDSRIYGAIPHRAIVGVLSFVYYASDETGIRWDRMNRSVS